MNRRAPETFKMLGSRMCINDGYIGDNFCETFRGVCALLHATPIRARSLTTKAFTGGQNSAQARKLRARTRFAGLAISSGLARFQAPTPLQQSGRYAGGSTCGLRGVHKPRVKWHGQPKRSVSGSPSNLHFYGGWGGFGEGLRLRTKMKENHHTPPRSSRGQQLTARYLRMIVGDDYEENYRPAWLFGMELDFYFPRLSLAVEFNGDQHHHYTAFGAPQEQQWRDWRKRKLCAAKGITIVSVKAIGLQYGSMRAKLKRAVGKKNLLPSRQGRAAQQELSRECAEYRKILIARFNSPTARRSGCKPFKDAVAASKKKYRQPL